MICQNSNRHSMLSTSLRFMQIDRFISILIESCALKRQRHEQPGGLRETNF